MHFRVLEESDSPKSSSVEYYMIDSNYVPIFYSNDNSKSFMYVKNESQASSTRNDYVCNGDLFDIVEEYRASFSKLSGNSAYYSSTDHRVEHIVCQPYAFVDSSK